MNNNFNPSAFEFLTTSGLSSTLDTSLGYDTEPDFELFPADISFAIAIAYPHGEDYSEEKFKDFRHEMVPAFIINAAHQTQTFGNYYLRNCRTGEMFRYTLDEDVYQSYDPTKKQ